MNKKIKRITSVLIFTVMLALGILEERHNKNIDVSVKLLEKTISSTTFNLSSSKAYSIILLIASVP